MHYIAQDLGLDLLGDWIDNYDWRDLRAFLWKHAAFEEYCRLRDEERHGGE